MKKIVYPIFIFVLTIFALSSFSDFPKEEMQERNLAHKELLEVKKTELSAYNSILTETENHLEILKKIEKLRDSTPLFIEKISPATNEFTVSTLKAFPEAYGGGAYATGGRGGQVIYVTTLNDSGPGSLREAIMTPTPRTIVFAVSGEIHLTSDIYPGSAAYGNLTIAGQSAPAGGVTITGHGIKLHNARNFIIRYLRFRNADAYDGLSLRGYSGNIDAIIDHCSFAWAKDEALDITSFNLGNVTVQNNHFYNNAKAMILGSSSNTTGNIGDFSVLRNTSASTSHRFPNFSGAGKIDIINNLNHNLRYRFVLLYSQDWQANHIGNYYQSGNNTIGSALNQSYSATWGKNRLTSGTYKIICNETMSPTLYSKYNHIDQDLIDTYQNAWDNDSFNQQSPTNNGWTSIDHTNYTEENDFATWTAFYTDATTQPKAEWFTNTQLPLLGATPTILLADDLKAELLPTTGACKTLNADGSVNFWRDSIDENSIDEILNDGSQSFIFESRPEWGANPTYTSVTRPAGFDTDNDGMPDTWEVATFGDLTRDGTGDFDSDGYTDVEEYLNLVDTPSVSVPVTGITWDNDTQSIGTGETVVKDATFSPANATNRGVTYSSSNTGVLSNNGEWVSQGTATYTITTNDGSFIDDMTVTCEAGTSPVTGVTVSPSEATVAVSGTQQFTATFDGSPSNQTGVWTSSNTSLATVNSYGLATAVSSTSDRVTNGAFDSGDGWILQDTNWSVSGGVASGDGTNTNPRSIYRDANILVERAYTTTISMSNRTAGGVRVYVGGSVSTPLINTNGTHTYTLYTDFIYDSNVWVQADTDFIGDIDDVVVAEMPVITYTTNDGGFTDTGIMILPISGSSANQDPQNVQSSNATQNSFTITWDAVTNASSYEVYIDNILVSTVTGGTTYNATGLTSGTSYAVRIVAKDISDVQLGETTVNLSTQASPLSGGSKTVKFKVIMN